MRKVLFLVFVISFVGRSFSNQSELPNIPDRWNAFWIGSHDAPAQDYNVVLFRKSFELQVQPNSFVIHVSADNRYRIYINGEYLGFGPQQSDIRHWRYETYDIAPLLKQGENIISAEVINYGEHRPFGIISHRTGFLLQGNTQKEWIVNSDDKTWKALHNKGHHPRLVNWMFGVDIAGGFYASSPGDSIVASQYPWGWQQQNFDDTDWVTAKWLQGTSTMGGSFGWILEPRNVPVQERRIKPLGKLVRTENMTVPQGILDGSAIMQIPANTKGSFLIDMLELTLGYPELVVSGGKDATISLQYAEALYYPDRSKGNRNQTDGKTMIGIRDVLVADGGQHRRVKPFWHRAFRYLKVNIETGSQPLVIESLVHETVEAPIPFRSSFTSDNDDFNKIMEVCLRTLRIGTQDILISDVYYETMQYVGDSRPHVLAWMTNTGDDQHFRNALGQFHNSRLPDGNLTSCYPLKSTFVHPTYSLIWIDMIHDYMMYRGDQDFIRPFIAGMDGVIDYFERNLNANGLPGKTRWSYFVDWYNHENSGGSAPVSKDGHSGVVSLHYVYTLRNAADINEWLGFANKAKFYRQRADEVMKVVKQLFYDEKKGVFAEDPEKTFYDQRVNIMAVLTDAIPQEKQAELLKTILTEPGYSRAGMYYRYNLFMALHKAGAGDLLDLSLAMWHEIVEQGLSTTPESGIDENPRSEAHPWAASPAWAFYNVVCGIGPAAPGYEKLVIKPSPGQLKKVTATYPHPAGDIKVRLSFDAGNVAGMIHLPEGPETSFIWNGITTRLKAGENIIDIK